MKGQNLKQRNVAFFSLARFGPGSIATLSLLALLAAALYLLGLKYFSILPAASCVLIFAIKSVEILQLSRPEERRFVGKRCLVIKRVGVDQRGVVKVYRDGTNLDPETWSAELACGGMIEEGKTAKIVGMRSIVLQVEDDSS